jgi:tetratricopeptide (TPR) repeat protein
MLLFIAPMVAHHFLAEHTMLKRTLFISAFAVTGFVGAVAFDARQASLTRSDSILLSTIGAPFCAGQPGSPTYRTFFRAAMADAKKPARTEVGPFSVAIPSAESIAKADANPLLVTDLGNLHYPITTQVKEAQQFFDQGLRLAYGFNHGEALRAFRKARTLDPDCAMCYWGEALVLGPNINAPMDPTAVAPAFEAVTKAKSLVNNETPKERALIDALTARYSKDEKADRAALDKAYSAAMKSVAASHTDDDNIAILYVESLMDVQPWDYWNALGTEAKGNTLEMMTLVEKVLSRSPDHPGAIHFYIHLTEASSDPSRAVPYAKRLADLTPGAGHLVHMPFHTFFRVGMYKDAIESNRKAVLVDERFIARASPVGMYPLAYYPHNVHSLMVSAQMAGDGKTVIESAGKLDRIVSSPSAKQIALLQPIKAAPYFAHAQFSDLKTILGLADPGADLPYVQAMWRYTRAVGYAGAGDVVSANAEVSAMQKLAKDADLTNLTSANVPAKETIQLATYVALGRIAQAKKEWAEAVKHFEAAVAIEDTLAYNEPPNWYYPTRQSLGASLVLAGDLEKAEVVLRTSLQRLPNNGWALYGLMKVYEQRGDRKEARAARQLLGKSWLGDSRTLSLARI